MQGSKDGRVLKVGGVAAEPPAGILSVVGEDGSRAGLVVDALLIGLDAVIFERRQQEVAYLHGVVTAAAPDAEAPDGPVAKPQQQDDGEQPEQCVLKLLFPDVPMQVGHVEDLDGARLKGERAG